MTDTNKNRRMRAIDASDLEETLKRVASAAAASVVATASQAATQVSATAAAAATALGESTRLDLQYIKEDLKEIKDSLANKFVTIEAFDPIRRLVYGVVGLMMAGVIGGLLAAVIHR